MSISDSGHDIVSVIGSMHSYEWSHASVAQFIVAQTPNADERPLHHKKHSRFKSNISPLSYAMLSGLSEISLCTYRSFDSISGRKISNH